MFAKTLVPGPLALPTLTATTSAMDTLLPQLLAHGWARYGAEGVTQNANGALMLTLEQRLQLVVAGQVLLEDVNPMAPPGWWEAVTKLEDRCVVNVLRTADVDLRQSDVGSRMRALLDVPGAGAWALLPVDHRETSPTDPTATFRES